MGILNDIAKRELSGRESKERDINFFDRDRFKEYFETHYECVFKYKDTYGAVLTSHGTGTIEYVSIPILYNNKYMYYLLYEFKNYRPDKIVIRMPGIVYIDLYKKYPDFFEKYKFKATMPSGGFTVDTRGEQTNEFTLKFIDDIIEIGDEKIWKKK